MFNDKKILVTGASGLIGRYLTNMLAKKGANVRAVIGKRPLTTDKNVEQIHGDLTEPSFCKKIMQDVDYVFHLAAFVGGVKQNTEHPASMMTKNLLLNSNVINAANDADVKKYIFMSCGCVYPDIEGVITEDSAWSAPPASGAIHFGWTKRVGELEAKSYQDEFGLKTAIVRPSNTYGPGDIYDEYRSHAVPALIMKAVKRVQPFNVLGNGTSKRDFIFVEDVANGLMQVLEKYTIGEAVNISTGIPTSVNELASLILKISGHKNAQIVHESKNLGGSSSKVLSTKKAQDKLNFQPIFSLEQGLKQTIDSYITNRY